MHIYKNLYLLEVLLSKDILAYIHLHTETFSFQFNVLSISTFRLLGMNFYLFYGDL